MKRGIAIGIITMMIGSIGFAADAQTDNALKDGRRWIVESRGRSSSYAEPYQYLNQYEVIGDSVINGTTYKCLYINILDSEEQMENPYDLWLEKDGLYTGGYSEECSSALYSWSADLETHKRLHKLPADTRRMIEMTICGVKRRVLIISDYEIDFMGYGSHVATVIEGIGPVDGNMLTTYPMPTNGAQRFHTILECYDGDTKIFDFFEYIRDLPEAIRLHTTAINDITADSDGEDAPLYDVTGRVVEHPRKGNIYLRKGSKIIWTGAE